jgi:hypothetical protein
MLVMFGMAITASRQFYLFVVYRNALGVLDVQGGSHHLWIAILAGLVACLAAGLMFFFFLSSPERETYGHITTSKVV